MSRTPRTPVYFPRMKVRGRRNKAKVAARYTKRHVIHVRFDAHDPVTGAVTGRVVPQGEATHVLAYNMGTRDGYGRRVPTPPPPPKPKPAPSQAFSMSVQFKQTPEQRDAFDALFNTITGRRPSALVQSG